MSHRGLLASCVVLGLAHHAEAGRDHEPARERPAGYLDADQQRWARDKWTLVDLYPRPWALLTIRPERN